MDDYWPAFFAGLSVLAVAGIAAWAWKPTRTAVRNWWNKQMRAADKDEEQAEERQLAVLREQVRDRARQLGINLPVSRSGNRVTYDNGKTTLFIPDHREYRRKMEARQVDIFNTVNKPPPTPLSWRDRAWLEKWLAEHPLP